MKKLVILCIFCIGLISCGRHHSREYRYAENGLIYNSNNNHLYTGKIVDTADVVIEFDVVNGKKNGRFAAYYRNGNIEKTGWIKSNLNEGEWKYFYSDGRIESHGRFTNDLPDGLWEYFYPDGSLKISGAFKRGLQNGEWLYYDKDGLLIKYNFYFEGILRNQFINLS